MKAGSFFALAVAAGAGAAPAVASGPLAITNLHAARAAALEAESAAIGPGGVIALRYSAYGRNISLPLSWGRVAGARAWAVIVQDPDAPGAAPFVHWLIWNIPGSSTGLPGGLPAVQRLASPAGALQGRNSAGGIGYHGPHPPAGRAHHYHIQVFALDAPVDAPAGCDLATLAAAMRGHVLAEGEAVGTFKAPARGQAR